MDRNLLIFGDSWAYGSELDPSLREIDAFGHQLAKMLDIKKIFNFSEVGSGIAHLHLQLDMARQHINTNDIAVFLLSGQERFMFFDQSGEFAHITATGPVVRPFQEGLRDQFGSINNFYFKHLHSTKSDLINLNTNLLALQARCRYHGINDYYISGWQMLDLWAEVDDTKIYGSGRQHCAGIFGITSNDLDAFKHNCYITPHQFHPNREGHALIAQELYKMITKT